jgi:hypothetical protein
MKLILAMVAAIVTMLLSFNPLIAAIVAIIVWRVSPLPAMAAGGAIGAVLKAR